MQLRYSEIFSDKAREYGIGTYIASFSDVLLGSTHLRLITVIVWKIHIVYTMGGDMNEQDFH